MRFRTPLLAFALLVSAGSLPAAEKSPLADAPSEFVRAQAGSGVQWHGWNDAAFAAARQANKCVYVFIGSPLSELTRATINQTFKSEKTVAWLNENFFCIFVDADAQPELAAYGQHYIRSIKQLQGSPVHLWLTPDLQVYDGANYLPPSEEWGKPGFLKSARSALDTWTGDANRARALAAEAVGMMHLPPVPDSGLLDAAPKLDAATKAWIGAVDAVHGGFGTAPKLPEPALIRFLLRRDPAAREAAVSAARAFVKGAVRDRVDGGFYRRTIDEAWAEPYYQKALVDQARFALALFDAADAAKDDALRAAATAALKFAWKDLRKPDGSLAAALDGTLDENADPAKRPSFVRVGTASTGALGLLVSASLRSGDAGLQREAKATLDTLRRAIGPGPSLPHQLGQAGPVAATAWDYAGVALACRAAKDDATADRLLARANELYFDAATGAYQASPAQLPTGITARVPASGDQPAAEVLAILAGVDAKTALQIRRGLLAGIEYDEQPPGDVLLGLQLGLAH